MWRSATHPSASARTPSKAASSSARRIVTSGVGAKHSSPPSMKSFSRFWLKPLTIATPGVSAVAGKDSVRALTFQNTMVGALA